MTSNQIIESNYRKYYGKLFASLLNQFGPQHLSRIEDAVQNAFYKSLKSWKPGQFPQNQENWLYVVAKNDLINQIKKESKYPTPDADSDANPQDLRLQIILLLAAVKDLTTQAKVIFTLKNVFGLSVEEIGENTLITGEAIYKSIQRTRKLLGRINLPNLLEEVVEQTNEMELALVEEILYAVFNVGYDSFNEKSGSILNDDLCLEAMALAKLLHTVFQRNSSQNLMALFCFHVARFPARVEDYKLIPFFQQDRTKWNPELVNLGFHYLEKPLENHKFYLEAVIAGKYLTSTNYDDQFWSDIIALYQILINLSGSPLLKINLSYCLHQAGRTDQALELLEKIRNELPEQHVYFSLVKATIIKSKNPAGSDQLVQQTLLQVKQQIRLNYLQEDWLKIS
ncbi:MAG: DUF6596 domain-containing protein [Candidatus Cyclobacteriaceae bacterium M3_2C_046]